MSIKKRWVSWEEFLNVLQGGAWTPSPHPHVKADITDTPWAWADVSKAGSNLTDLTTRQHVALTDVTANQHHDQLHASTHEPSGSDQIDLVFNSQKWSGQTIYLTDVQGGDILYYSSVNFRWENAALTTPLHASTHEPSASDQIDLVFNSQKWNGQTIFLTGVQGGDILYYDSTDFRWENAAHDKALHNALALTELGTVDTGIWQATAIGWTYVSKTGSNLTDLATRQHAGLSDAPADAHHPQSHTLASHSTKPHSALTGVTSDQHHPQSHTLASHSTKAHSELTDIGVNDHHAQAHTLASHSTKAHSELTGVTADLHHPQSHTLVSHTGRDHHNLIGLGDDDHSIYYNAARHTKAIHDALGIEASNTEAIDGVTVVAMAPSNNDILTYVSANTRWEAKPLGEIGGIALGDLTDVIVGVPDGGDLLEYQTGDSKWHSVTRFPDTIANLLSDHNLATHNALSIDHGSLSGRGDDDHSQYYNAARHTKAIHTSLGLFPYTGGTFTGYVYASNHGAAATDMVVNVCYGTGSPPAVGGTTHGTIFLKYTA